MFNIHTLSLSDKNKDSKIHIEEHNNEDKIRFITEGQQRMIISNSTTSGNIGIGLNFNNPTSTLDIQGDLAVSNKIGIGTSTVETSLDINSSLKVFDVLNDVSGYVNTSDGNYMKLQATSRTDTSTKKNIILNSDGGNVGIGTTNPQFKLDIDGNVRIAVSNILFGCSTLPSSNSGGAGFEAASYDRMILKLATTRLDHSRLVGFYTPNGMMGDIQTTTTGCLFQSLSDYRVKENIIYNFDATTSFKKLKPAKFNFIVDPEQIMIGFLAHELQEVVPAAVSGTKDSIDDKGNPDYQCIDVSKIVPLIVKTVQELEIRVSEIEQSNEILETKNTELETKNTELETKYNDLLARVLALENN